MAENKKCKILCRVSAGQGTKYTKIIVSGENYYNVCRLSSISNRSMQDVTDELLTFAFANIEICKEDGTPLNIPF